jgi:NADH dehydrogenase
LIGNMNRILVLGGTGFVGRSVCERLTARSSRGAIVVPTRRAQHGNSVRALPTVEVVQANVHDDTQLARLVAGCDAVINLVAILHGSRAEFDRVHVALPRRLAAACVGAGVRRLVHISALGVGPQAPSNYLRSKTEGEAVLMASNLAVTVLRPSVIFGAEDRFLNLFAELQAVVPLVPLAGSSARFQPVWVEDVARAVVQCLDDAGTIGKIYECAGPAEYTLSQLVERAGTWAGHMRPQLPLPAFIGRLQALAMEMLPGQPMMSRDNIDSMRVPNVATGPLSGLPGLAELGITATALEAVAPAYLGSRFARARLNRWRAGAGRS